MSLVPRKVGTEEGELGGERPPPGGDPPMRLRTRARVGYNPLSVERTSHGRAHRTDGLPLAEETLERVETRTIRSKSKFRLSGLAGTHNTRCLELEAVGMAMNKLVSIGGTSAGVSLPLDELRDEGVVSGGKGGEPLEIEETMMRIHRFDEGVWQVVQTDVHDFPAHHEKPAYSEPAQATVEA